MFHSMLRLMFSDSSLVSLLYSKPVGTSWSPDSNCVKNSCKYSVVSVGAGTRGYTLPTGVGWGCIIDLCLMVCLFSEIVSLHRSLMSATSARMPLMLPTVVSASFFEYFNEDFNSRISSNIDCWAVRMSFRLVSDRLPSDPPCCSTCPWSPGTTSGGV